MKSAKFRISSDIIRRLGEELNPSPEQSILELIKNSYDADAHRCIVKLIDTEAEGGSIHIYDEGDGMLFSEIRDGWFVIGSSEKHSDKKTKLGRIPAGNKGLGRLAALRMGKSITLITRPKKSNKQYSVSIDWDLFDQAKFLNDFSADIQVTERPKNAENGTEIYIEKLKSPLSKKNVERLAKSMILLANPFDEDVQGFKISLEAPEYKELEELVNGFYFSEADYHLIACVDMYGVASAVVMDHKGQELFKAEHLDLKRSGGFYLCPALKFELWSFILVPTNFATRSVNFQQVREWVRNFGGVHFYLNGLRVNPYGNPGNDWLDMNLARTRSPEEKPSTNNSIGKVSIIDAKGTLKQKTDRSGFIEDETFEEIKQFAKDALVWMGRKRLDRADKVRAQKRVDTPKASDAAKENVKKAIKTIPSTSRQEVERAFNTYNQAREKEINVLREEVQLYRSLSTAGITSAIFAHESAGSPIKVITYTINAIKRRIGESRNADLFAKTEEPIGLIISSVQALRVLGNITLSLIDHEKRKITDIDIHERITKIMEMFQPFTEERNINVKKELSSGTPFVRGSEAALEAIMTNLLNNSIQWLEDYNSPEPIIIVRTEIQEKFVFIHVLDSGPGIKDIDVKEIWLPGRTTKSRGTGLGLTIVRDTVIDLGGTVNAIDHCELGGAEIIINLPLTGGQNGTGD